MGSHYRAPLRAAPRCNPLACPSTNRPASVKKSVTPDAVVCLCCGEKFKALKRHLGTEHHLTPAEYRAAFNLKSDHPLVAPNYAAKRSELAKFLGLGRKAGTKSARAEKDRHRKGGCKERRRVVERNARELRGVRSRARENEDDLFNALYQPALIRTRGPNRAVRWT